MGLAVFQLIRFVTHNLVITLSTFSDIIPTLKAVLKSYQRSLIIEYKESMDYVSHNKYF
jgi:hypothetical protein